MTVPSIMAFGCRKQTNRESQCRIVTNDSRTIARTQEGLAQPLFSPHHCPHAISPLQ